MCFVAPSASHSERSKFVFTPEMAHVMGGKDSPKFKEFQDLCYRALNILRQYVEDSEGCSSPP